MRSRLLLIATLLALILLLPAGASATLITEQHQGQQLLSRLQAGTITCNQLSAEDLDHIGEYVMFRALGSTVLHQAMNQRMTLMMGEQAESRMHQFLGARYTGCSVAGLANGGLGSMMSGTGMMGGYYNSGGWGAMMSTGDWSWMRGGTWQHMSRHDWQQLQQRLLGTSTGNSNDGWSALAITGVIVAAVIIAALAILGLTHRWPFRRPPATAAAP